MEVQASPTELGKAAYEQWRTSLRKNPEYQAIYEAEAAKSELWLQLVEARQSLGLTQEEMARRLGVSRAQVARLEKRGYDAYTLASLRRYVKALGGGFELKVSVERNMPLDQRTSVTAG